MMYNFTSGMVGLARKTIFCWVAVFALLGWANLEWTESSRSVHASSISTPGGANTNQGTVSSVPGTCTTGDLYFATDGPYNARCSGVNVFTWFIQGYGGTFTPLVTGNFTAFNIGSVTTTNTGGVMNLTDQANESGLHGYCANEPATPTVITIPIRSFSIPGVSNNPYVLVAFGDGTKFETIHVNVAEGTSTNVDIGSQQWSNSTTFSGNIVADVPILGQSSIMGFQLSDDGTTKKWFYTIDGTVYIQFASEPRATFLTPTKYCFGLRTASVVNSVISGTFLGVQLH